MNSPTIRALRLAAIAATFAELFACAPASDSSSTSGDAAASADAAPVDAACPDVGLGIYAACWTACSDSLATACAKPPGVCVMDWPSDATSFCAVHNAGDPSHSTAVAEACGPYRALLANGVDGGYDFYYSAATGKLVAVVSRDYVFETARCLGGPPDFVEPTCDWVSLDCHDAGAAGSAGAAGADAGP